MTPRRELVEPNAPLSMRWQCELLGVNRSSLYYEPVEPDGEQLALMRRMDELHLKHPFFGSRMMTQTLKAEGSAVNRKRVQRLMRLMGLESTAPKPNTSKPAPEHAVYPYLLRNLTVSRINQVWAADITYIPMARGFVYLVAVIDWYSRRVLAWRLSNTLETTFCVEALNEAVARYGCPEIFNTDQGSQFTSEEFTSVLLALEIKISMDGKGRCIDNIFVERLWRSLKYEEVYLYAYDTVQMARAGIACYFDFFNDERPAQSVRLSNARELLRWTAWRGCLKMIGHRPICTSQHHPGAQRRQLPTGAIEAEQGQRGHGGAWRGCLKMIGHRPICTSQHHPGAQRRQLPTGAIEAEQGQRGHGGRKPGKGMNLATSPQNECENRRRRPSRGLAHTPGTPIFALFRWTSERAASIRGPDGGSGQGSFASFFKGPLPPSGPRIEHGTLC